MAQLSIPRTHIRLQRTWTHTTSAALDTWGVRELSTAVGGSGWGCEMSADLDLTEGGLNYITGITVPATRRWRAAPVCGSGFHRCLYITSASTSPCLGCLKADGSRPTTSKPYARQVLTARSLVLTTKLNCIARNDRAFARASECSSIARPTPLPSDAGDVM